MRYIDADALIKKIYPMGIGDGKYTINAKAVKLAIDNAPAADVVPKSEEGAECPICHGTGRIGTTNWLTKNMTKKQIAEEKAKAIAEHEQHIKQDYAKEIFAEIEKWIVNEYVPYIRGYSNSLSRNLAELKKKYTGGLICSEKT